MARLRLRISMSLDGFVAGPEQSVKNPLGVGGEGLHQWVIAFAAWRSRHGMQGGEVNESTRALEEEQANIGATIMGRNMFGGHPGPWNASKPWNGWWGDEPPFHPPVFVLTHHARAPLQMQGGTTFTFVTDGIQSALELARKGAAGKDIARRRWRSAWLEAVAHASDTLGSPSEVFAVNAPRNTADRAFIP